MTDSFKTSVANYKALENIESRAFQIATTFYKKFQSLGWRVSTNATEEILNANTWIMSALWCDRGEPSDRVTSVSTIKNIKNALRVRARERADAWEFYEAHLEEFAALETAARMLAPDAPQL